MSTLASPPPISPLGVSPSAYKYPNPILFCTSHFLALHIGSSVLAIRSYSSQACGSLMSEGKHHHFFHHHKEEDQPVDGSGACVEETPDYEKEMKHHKHKEHLGELGTVAAGAFALHEKHKAKKDPENAHKHKIQEEIAATLAVGAGGYAFHERHEKKEAKEEKKAEEGHHHHHF